GRATRLLARGAAGIGLGYAGARRALPRAARCRVTGTPLRGDLRADGVADEFGLSPHRPTLLVLGGSQGAAGLNEKIAAGIATCRDLDFQVLHCSGSGDLERMRSVYDAQGVSASVHSFLPDIGRAYAIADLVLSRAGASTVAECAAMERPAVFVPYPWHKDRQQVHNAWESVRAGAARVVEEQDLDPRTLREIVGKLLLDGERRNAMADAARAVARPNAAQDMAAHLLESFGPAIAGRAVIVELCG
ncbi:MAG: UDP-N-acetylglucosamine--N-acetylmuramyl-(pentapeptide) pyrophosphoryl-undecaprenol N-acetylglucosamine transferase, partial [Planctomycetota bacterium]|nr:UDP-N-acetylglucosamine--N-acetylmuramyl-(pentapeptide) pyrophosphoryl-undecaprenol N-acetylglucosamine transferase [Planctomycetota bacterium]